MSFVTNKLTHFLSQIIKLDPKKLDQIVDQLQVQLKISFILKTHKLKVRYPIQKLALFAINLILKMIMSKNVVLKVLITG
jgi:hypothetical protein